MAIACSGVSSYLSEDDTKALSETQRILSEIPIIEWARQLGLQEEYLDVRNAISYLKDDCSGDCVGGGVEKAVGTELCKEEEQADVFVLTVLQGG